MLRYFSRGKPAFVRLFAHIHAPALLISAPSCASSSASSSTTFVSSHYRLDTGTITAYLARRDLPSRDSPTHFIVRNCPLCSKPHGDKPDNLWKLYIRKADGAYFCHRCGAGGSWYDFKAHLGDGPPEGSGGGRAGSTAANSAGSGGGSRSMNSSDDPFKVAPLSALPLADSFFVSGGSGAGGVSFDAPGSMGLGLGGGGDAVNGGFTRSAAAAAATGFQRSASSSGRGDSGGVSSGTSSSSGSIAGASVGSDVASVLAARDALLRHNRHGNVYRYLTVERGLTKAVLAEYCVGAVSRRFPASPTAASTAGTHPVPPPAAATTDIHECVVFPWLSRVVDERSGATTSTGGGKKAPPTAAAGVSPNSALEDAEDALFSGPSAHTLACQRVKLRSVSDKAKQMLAPRGGSWGLFGLHTVPPHATSVVLTEGEGTES